jgi:hypothetical protein
MPELKEKNKCDLTENDFCKLLPDYLQRASKTYFTPFHIVEIATQWLTEDGRKRILDIGAGVGKFCIGGARNSDSYFYGVEYRSSLSTIANGLIDHFEIQNAIVENINVLEVDFTKFDAFYLFNPFYENLEIGKRLNNEVQLADSLYHAYIKHTCEALNKAGKGTRVVTYHGDTMEVPLSFTKLKTTKDGLLNLWIKK